MGKTPENSINTLQMGEKSRYFNLNRVIRKRIVRK
jgi:hypothetical protein